MMTGITRSRHNRSQFFIFRAQNQISFCLCPFSSTTPASTKAFFSLQSFIYGCSTCTILSRNSISGFVTYKVNQTPWITPNLNIRRKLIKVIPTYQPNRVLFHKPTDFRFKVVHQAVMQSGLFIIILVVQSERLMCVPIDPFLISGAPRRCIRRTTGDWGGQSSLWDTDVVGAEISEVFILLCFGCCGRLWLGGSSLCRCTPEVIDYRPRRNGYVSGRCSSKPVCLGVLWRAFVRTGRRRMPRSQGGCQLDKMCC